MEKKSIIEREIYPQVLKWLDEPEIIAIAGPRQAGKTTILRQLQEKLGQNCFYLSLEETSQLESFLKSPKDFILLKSQGTDKFYFLFDEFQYVENGGKILKTLYDEFSPNNRVKFIITGSSSLKIREIASFLVGRVIFLNLSPFNFGEFLLLKDKTLYRLWQKFHLFFEEFLNGKKLSPPQFIFFKETQKLFEEYLIYGGYPAVASSSLDKKQERLESLIETYIEKDIIKYLRIGNFLGFKNLARILAVQIGNLVNYSSLGNDAVLSLGEIKSFLENLEQTFVIKLLLPFFTNKITEIKKSPKVYYYDLGLRNGLISDFRDLNLRQDKGALAENFVLTNFLSRKQFENLKFWRTKQGAEMDFTLNFKNELIPLEVKFQEFMKPKLSRSSLSFLEAFKPARAIILTKNLTEIIKIGKTEILFLPIYFI